MSRKIFTLYNSLVKNIFNRNLALFRKRSGLSQREFAKRLGVTHRTIAYYESETNSIPLDKLEKIAIILNINPGDLVNSIENNVKHFPEVDLKLVKKLQQIKQLPDRDQRAISNHINALVDKNKSSQK